MNTFNMKQWLQENKAGAYDKMNEIDPAALGAAQDAADASFDAAGDGNVDNIDEEVEIEQKKVKELKPGDVLRGTSAKVTWVGQTAKTPNGKTRVDIEDKNGRKISKYWNSNTMVGVRKDVDEIFGYVMKTKPSDPNRREPLEM
jgi:hypothetical protein